MYNLSDEEFDRLCRDAAEKPDVQVPVDGWDRMKLRLNREMPEDKRRRRTWLLWIPFLIFLPISLFYWKKDEMPIPVKDIPASAASVSTIRASDPARPGKNQRPAQDHIDKQSPTGQPETETAHSPRDQAGTEKQVFEDVRAKAFGGPSDGVVTGESARKARLRRANLNKIRLGTRNTKNPGPVEPASPGPVTEKVQARSPEPVQSTADSENQQLPDRVAGAPQASKAFTGVNAISGTDTANSYPAGTQDKIPSSVQPNKNSNSFGITFLAGPDWSNVNFDATDKAGLNIGVMAAYRFHARWSIEAGLLYSRKHYTVMGDDYNGYPGYNPSNPSLKMDKVEANCFMLDIPVNIQYDVLQRPRHRAFASIGLSTYIMNKEDLHYYYSYNNNPQYKAWENDNPATYLFAAANISAGYEYRFNPSIAVRVEPFLKLPIRSVGYGSIDLNSLGVFFGFNFRPFHHNTAQSKK